jgi:hypothetical protein
VREKKEEEEGGKPKQLYFYQFAKNVNVPDPGGPSISSPI